MLSPAHNTKHVALLPAPFHASSFLLAQRDDGVSNGTALWLGAQCMAHFLATLPVSARLVELGSGIGYTAYAVSHLSIPRAHPCSLAMSSLGWDVLATDTAHVISTVLAKNIRDNATRSIHVRELDWTIPPHQWSWTDSTAIASTTPSLTPALDLSPPFDLVCSADTVYSPDLVQPLLRTIHALCTLSRAASPSARAPPAYLCIERRDPALVDHVLAQAHTTWGFSVHRVPHHKLLKALRKARITWPRHEWDAVEIWKLTLPRIPLS
ncbi:hypothetical protein H0H81_008839 [Sphagnurus paluster]|uniref:Uncharacterized protein n=1 Tax=Sphagnurus paluster TaxID=117069 RepID=A0A9P7KNY6_9AGAR|nr:hypothetical protein H0H81_008839 [Sphagnurus paluster]